ncbi:sugar phosphate isomerase/epimerase family protein [Neptunicoccus sediminis]|uniref:sugar phosphate isomerase/epimerase family protein n=1 Tax=Neptunicoccus sediminis TaxID=1892596 RepID=UPI000845F1D3|nr:sugar phosphate isomerase/epimerase [Neptunicoccus sediminis]
MKIGMCMFLWTTRITPQHESLLTALRDTGFDGVEIPVFEGTPEEYRQIAVMLDRIGLERTAVTAMGDPSVNLISPQATTRKAGVDYMDWALECTAALGADQISGPLHSTLGLFSGAGPTGAELDYFRDTQLQIGDLAAGHGIVVGLEALNRFECYLFNTMDALCDHLRALDHPNITAMYDTFHANIEETDPVGALIRNSDMISHIHISENDRGVPGRGNISWAETFAAIARSGYDDWLTIEAFGRGLPDLAAATKVWRDFADSPEQVYREGYAHIRACMDKAGLTVL